ncbi:MAG: alpha/beta hydrolase family protein [Promethearchaeota archaeon]
MPEPTGPFSIGTTTYELTDYSRNETFTEDPDDFRKLLIKTWYPANSKSVLEKKPQKYLTPEFYFKDLAKIPTHSFVDVSVSDSQEKYPVILFSHGYGAFEGLYQVLMEELASQGFIIFSINHPYEAAFTYFSLNSIVKIQVELPTLNQEEEILKNILSSPHKTLEEKRITLALMENSFFWSNQLEESLTIWTEDTQFVLDQLEISNSNRDSLIGKIFYNKLDLDKIGIIGHSFGGATAGEMCLIDDRIKAGINMDGIEIGHALTKNLSVPFMFMYSNDFNRVNNVLFLQAENDAYSMVIDYSEHMNFCDYSIVSNYFIRIGMDLGLLGAIKGQRMLEIMNLYVSTFFNEYLLGIESSLLNETNYNYPEVRITSR